MKRTIILFFLFCFIGVSAHEFWLQPNKFIYKKGEKATIRFFAGEDFKGTNWNGDRSNIKILYLYSKNSKYDFSQNLTGGKGDSIQLFFGPNAEEGTAMFAFNSTNSLIKLEAAKFNAYLEEEGLQEAISYRKEHHETDSAGRESYQRSVKTIFQIGNKYDSTFKMRTVIPLDIIPLEHPYLIKKEDSLTVRVLFNTQLLPGQLIRVWHRQNNKTTKEEMVTDQKGCISFLVKPSGRWMLSTVLMVHTQNDPKADWQSYWGSCTWGYQ